MALAIAVYRWILAIGPGVCLPALFNHFGLFNGIMNVFFGKPFTIAIDIFPSGAGDQGVGLIDCRVSDWAGNRGQGQGQ